MEAGSKMPATGALLPPLSQRYYSKPQYVHGQGAKQTALTTNAASSPDCRHLECSYYLAQSRKGRDVAAILFLCSGYPRCQNAGLHSIKESLSTNAAKEKALWAIATRG